MTSEYISDELFHFVGYSSPTADIDNYQTLVKVIKSGCISHAPHDGTWGDVSHVTTWDNHLETEQLVIPTVTCYADIPFKSLSIHTSKYGKFGMALPNELLIKHGARPVMYVPTRSDDWQSPHGLTLLRDIEAIVKDFNEQIIEKYDEVNDESRRLGKKPSSPEAAVRAINNMLLKDFLAFIKPFNSELPLNDRNNYYLEREWRKYGNMKFEPNDVTRIVVAKGYMKQAEKDLPAYEGRIFET